MAKHKQIFSSVPVFEADYAAFEETQTLERKPKVVNGYHTDLGFHINNLHILQERYKDEIGDHEAIIKKVQYLDISAILFPKTKLHFRWWKAHLIMVGRAMTYCNHGMTPFQIKNALFKVFQKNIYIPNSMQPSPVNYGSFWKSIGEQLDDIVESSIMQSPKKGKKRGNKILFDPSRQLTPKQRQTISKALTGKARSNKTVNQLSAIYVKGMTQKELAEKSGRGIATIKRKWLEIKAA
ncbi:hypothetical protein [Costertonia aggregata]|uniref:Uncharacterized protein n=1 Tax=Costertonia aggregata TaxID=343403 RepID=A0A7H9ARK2_9FLAO|nr:hypothetical protein [Costertonia aggregata]QLG46037.1 hypothetical protein HYG79_12010 [Costertonia aggregata]